MRDLNCVCVFVCFSSQRWVAGRSGSRRSTHRFFRCHCASNCVFLIRRLNALGRLPLQGRLIEATAMQTLGELQFSASGARALLVNGPGNGRCGANSKPVATHIVEVKRPTPQRSLSSHRSLPSSGRYGDAFRVCEVRRADPQRRPSGFAIRAQSLASPPTQTKQVFSCLHSLTALEFA